MLLLLTIAAAALPTLLSGCAAVVVAGATYSAAVVYDRRSADVVLDDEVIEVQARNAYLGNPDLHKHSQLRATSYAHTVLITGQAESPQIADRFARVVAQLPKVKQVYNEAEVGPKLSLSQISQDALITSRAKLAIQSVNIPGFDTLRVKVITENGVVYLMGLVTPEEGDAAAEKVRRVPGVKRVVKIFEYIEPQRPTDPA
ncbi:BON domain-containing protein [Thiohalocapsa sp. ML1]|uniref:BON domain-containing protein n=1 Tax=Thiohalocapsa sp. ML1 TaxID=1431688 RepID=UPI000731FE2F|nr:BON domain-containing protein [Thiohalocapsa sp. ML1]